MVTKRYLLFFFDPQEFASSDKFCKAAIAKCQKFPVLIKPNKGLDGRGILYIDNIASLKRELKNFYKLKSVIIIQPIIAHPEFRILVINNEIELVHSKDFRAVTGDGISTIGDLLEKVSARDKNEDYIKLQFKLNKYNKKTVLRKDEEFKYHIVKNSSGRHFQTSDYSEEVIKWTKHLADSLNMGTFAIDLFADKDLKDSSKFTIIELNSNPGLAHYVKLCNDSSQPKRICERVLRDYFKLN